MCVMLEHVHLQNTNAKYDQVTLPKKGQKIDLFVC